MTECNCTDIKRIVMCELQRGDGPCLSETPEPAQTTPPPAEPLGLGSDALINSVAAKFGGAEIVTEL
ncbi:hypothetical protein ACIPWF_04190 [Paenarthrobacter sp. NPDC089989]|uniref:hypothetical protein n=1 Tax=unclassified Paenarthrobacter TaxID=2634190 RepID=UPI00380EE2F5